MADDTGLLILISYHPRLMGAKIVGIVAFLGGLWGVGRALWNFSRVDSWGMGWDGEGWLGKVVEGMLEWEWKSCGGVGRWGGVG